MARKNLGELAMSYLVYSSIFLTTSVAGHPITHFTDGILGWTWTPVPQALLFDNGLALAAVSTLVTSLLCWVHLRSFPQE